MGEWDERPGAAGREWFEQTLARHTRVEKFRSVGDQVYVVQRRGLPDVRVWLCDVYTLGVADYEAIRNADPAVDAIVVLSAWNHYTAEAQRLGASEGVGLFKPAELMSALHRQGDEFVRRSGS
jgi:hypothetical protein